MHRNFPLFENSLYIGTFCAIIYVILLFIQQELLGFVFIFMWFGILVLMWLMQEEEEYTYGK